MSFSVNQRTQEMGVRKALGAAPRNILAMIFKQSSRQIRGGYIHWIIAGDCIFLKSFTASYSNFSPYDLSVYYNSNRGNSLSRIIVSLDTGSGSGTRRTHGSIAILNSVI